MRAAALLPAKVIQERAAYREHVNGSLVHATDELMSLGEDVTARFRAPK